MKSFVIATVSVFALLGAANAEEKAAEMNKESKPAHTMEGKEHCPPHLKHHKHHKHHGHHGHKGHMRQGHALAVYVNYPLLNVAAFSECPCEYYEGNQAHPYIWHEGYFWYPHAQADVLLGYTPHHMHGSYWYPSRVHPHTVYIDQQNMMPHEIYPVQMGSHDGAVVGHKKHHRHHHKGKKHHAAPAKQAKPE